MNLYDLHDSPKSLKHHEKAHDLVPALAWKKLYAEYDGKELLAKLKENEAIWAKDPHTAYKYADRIRMPFPAGEAQIAKNGKTSYQYASRILDKPFPAGEPAMLRDGYDYDYAMWPLNARWPEAEKLWLKRYAEHDSKAPDILMMNDYISKYLPNKRWPELERALIKAEDAFNLYAYANIVLRKPFPEAEHIIAKDSKTALTYATYVLRGNRFKAGEKAIYSDTTTAAKYETMLKNSASSRKFFSDSED